MKPATLSDFIGRLFEIGLVSQSNAVSVSPHGGAEMLVEVGDTSPTSLFSPSHENSLRHYVEMFTEGRYSLILCDGGLLSLKYVVSANGKLVTWHRYSYFPPIARIDVSAGDGPDDLPAPDLYVSVPRAAMLRFEFESGPTADDHPPSHLHMNAATCRLPVGSRLGVSEFLHFVVDNFYPEFRDRYLGIVPVTMSYRNDLNLADQARFRLAVPTS